MRQPVTPIHMQRPHRRADRLRCIAAEGEAADGTVAPGKKPRRLLDIGPLRKAAATRIRKLADSAAKSISECVLQSCPLFRLEKTLGKRPRVMLR